MDVLAAAAQAEAELAGDAAEPVHADDRDQERGDLPSDDEDGPPEPDEGARDGTSNQSLGSATWQRCNGYHDTMTP